MNTETKVSLGFFSGIIAGICAGLLLAPEKGNKTRKKILAITGNWKASFRRFIGLKPSIKRRKTQAVYHASRSASSRRKAATRR